MAEQDKAHLQEFHLSIDSPIKPADLLAEKTNLSKQTIKSIMKKGAVWLTRGNHTRRLRRANSILKPDDEVHLYYNADVLDAQVPEAQLISDEGAYSIWHKPCGMLSQGSKWGDHTTISRWAETQLQPERPAFIVHRLDKATSGLMIIAHSKTMAKTFSRLFESRLINKKYQAIVGGRLLAAVTVDQPLDGKKAISHFCEQAYDKLANISLLDVDIETGRKHQIRQHLSAHGYAILGDRLYGDYCDAQYVEPINLQLCAYQLVFMCPVSGQEKRFELPQSLKLNFPVLAKKLFKAFA